MSTRTKMWSKGGSGHYTNKEDMYMTYLRKLLPEFTGGSVLEIGPGTGKFAEKIISNFSTTSYTVLDLEENILDSVNYIKKKKLSINIEPVVSDNYTQLFDREFDLVVSNICIPETPKDYREAVLNAIIPNSKASIIIGQLTGDWVEGNEYESWIKNLFNNRFEKVKCELTPYANCYALAGKKQ